jgi:hypothetical protein
MFEVVWLCAIANLTIQCLPVVDMEACRSMEAALSIEMVEESTCTYAEIYHPAAPLTSPQPVPRPAR